MNIRLASEKDALDLFILNELFNGVSNITVEAISASIKNNAQEKVFVAESDNKIVGFCCVQLFKSFCYENNYAEITELFVKEEYLKQGIGTAMMTYAEEFYVGENIAGFQLFTGGKNIIAQSFYEKQGYIKTDEIMYRKR